MNQRDLEILQLLSEGFKAWEVGDKLKLSRRTVEKYVELLFIEFDAKNTTHLIAIAIRKKIII